MDKSALPDGIDVSHYQGEVNWPAVRAAGVSFGFAKASQGRTNVDAMFARNWAGMRAAGVARGAYHFLSPLVAGKDQASHFLAVMGDDHGELPAVLDIETGAPAISDIQAWLDGVEEVTGTPPMIYTSPAFGNAHLQGAFGRYPLWVAEYGVRTPKPTHGWSDWAFWQYTDSATVPGVKGTCDGSRRGTAAPHLTAQGPASAPQPAQVPSAQNTYTVKPGDTLSQIARAHGITTADLAERNGLKDPNLLKIGQILELG